MTSNSPRFARTTKIAARFIRDHGITRLPVEPQDIISAHNNWKAKTYDAYANRHGITVNDVIEWADSKDGCVHYYVEKNRALIFYNDNPLWIDNPYRIRWTLMHEIGHIVLGHLKETKEAKISRNTLSEEKYEQLEKEAHFFAACVLAPHIVLYKLNVIDSRSIRNLCNISTEAAEKRFLAYQKWKSRKKLSIDDFHIYTQFRSFILNKKCIRCGNTLISDKAKYCSICGQELEWGEGNMIYSDGFILDDNSKAVVCPRCGNEEPEKGDYCSICGAYLINRCTDITYFDEWDREIVEKDGCGEPAAGNARYCTYCGNQTTYYKSGFLVVWEEAQEQIKKAETPESQKNKWDEIELVDINEKIPF